jgi:hypothetical protein
MFIRFLPPKIQLILQVKIHARTAFLGDFYPENSYNCVTFAYFSLKMLTLWRNGEE